jgi:hypothetical protein
MSSSYISSPPSACMACSGTALALDEPSSHIVLRALLCYPIYVVTLPSGFPTIISSMDFSTPPYMLHVFLRMVGYKY